MSHGSSRASSLTTSPTPRVWVPRHVALLITRLVAPLVVDYFAYAARPGASACRAARHAARQRLLRLRRASGCLGTSRGSSRSSSHRSSSTTLPKPRVRVPRHVAQLVTRFVTRLIVDYFASLNLVVEYLAYGACPGASARRTACDTARRRLLGCVAQLVTRLISPLVADYSTLQRLVVDYFAYVVRPGAWARRAARRRLLRLCRASVCPGTPCGSSSTTSTTPRVQCLGTSRGSSRGSSSTISRTLRVRVP
jgi:hypothetical protein